MLIDSDLVSSRRWIEVSLRMWVKWEKQKRVTRERRLSTAWPDQTRPDQARPGQATTDTLLYQTQRNSLVCRNKQGQYCEPKIAGSTPDPLQKALRTRVYVSTSQQRLSYSPTWQGRSERKSRFFALCSGSTCHKYSSVESKLDFKFAFVQYYTYMQVYRNIRANINTLKKSQVHTAHNGIFSY